eukprot:5541440-Prymnesium_polylepis.1
MPGCPQMPLAMSLVRRGGRWRSCPVAHNLAPLAACACTAHGRVPTARVIINPRRILRSVSYHAVF